MRFSALTISIFLFFNSSVHAQKFGFGPAVKAGISQVIHVRSDSIVDHDLNNQYRFSFQAGAFGSYDISNAFSVALELLYWQQSERLDDAYSYNDPLTQVPVDQTDILKSNVSYVATPLILQYNLQGITLFAGGQPSFSFSQNGNQHSVVVKDGVETETPKEDFDPDYFGIDAGFKLGIHYRISDFLRLGIEYYNGRVNLSKENNDPYTSRNEFIYAGMTYNILREKKEEFYTD